MSDVTLKLYRMADDANETRGRCENDEGQVVCITLERPWKNNQRDISRILAGRYFVKKEWSNHFQRNMPHLQNVPGRDGVLIHWGNYFSNSEGCILLGRTFADINGDGELDATNSKNAFDKFDSVTPDEFWLEIIDIDAEQAVAA